jgi:hypothetical protein
MLIGNFSQLFGRLGFAALAGASFTLKTWLLHSSCRLNYA